MTDVDVSTAPVANEHGTQNNQGFTAPTGGHWGATKPERVVRGRYPRRSIRPVPQVCANCQDKPRRKWKSGAVDSYCVECSKKKQRTYGTHHEAALAMKLTAKEKAAIDAALPKVYVRPPAVAAPASHQWRIQPPKRDSNGNPVRDYGSPTVVLMSEDETAQAKANASKWFDQSPGLCR